MAVKASGPLRIVRDDRAVHRIVSRLTDDNEAQRPAPWALSDAPEPYTAAMLKGIVGIAISIEALAGSWKLSQNRSAPDRLGVQQNLQAEGGRGEAVAGAMACLATRDDRSGVT